MNQRSHKGAGAFHAAPLQPVNLAPTFSISNRPFVAYTGGRYLGL
jgi:hypothetical protein